MNGETIDDRPVDRVRWWSLIAPIGLLAVLIAVIVWTDPAEVMRGDVRPPIERLAVQRVTLSPGGISVTVLNDGPDPVTIAQVTVDDAYWAFQPTPAPTLRRLERATLTVPYPWVEGETHALRIVTSTGMTFDHEIAVALETPRPDRRFFVAFALVGLYVGVLPVSIGLLWFPMVARLGRTGLDFVLALTIGLLLFLLIDAGHEGLESAAAAPESYQGVALFLFCAAGAYLGLEVLSRWLRARHGPAQAGGGLVLAMLVAVGIGLHNFAEGLAIGSAFSLGEAALGALLIVGFALHNTTEGLAIVAPLARERVRLVDLARLGLVGGVPTIAGAWLGGLVYSPTLAVVCLAIGAGAVAQVVMQIVRQMAGERPGVQSLANLPVAGGLMAGFLVMYVTGMLVG